MNKYFGGRKVTYADLEKKMLAMKSKPSEDRKKMAVLFFLASILVGGRKSGEGASPVTVFLRVVDDLDACVTFLWGRYAFEHNLKDVSSFLEKCDGVAATSWVFTSFPIPLELLAFEAIPSLRNHFREDVYGASSGCPRMCKMQYKRKSGTKEFSLKAVNDKLGNNTKDIESILVATAAEEELLETIRMDKESCWADDADDAAVDRWTKIIRKGKKQVFFEEQFRMDFESRTDSVEATGATPGAEALKAMEGRLMNAVRDAVRDAMKGVKEKVTSLSTQLGLLEEEVKSLRWSVPGSDNPAVQDDGDGSDNSESEEEDGDVGGDKESEEEDGGDNNEPDEEDGSDNDVEDAILDISKDVQREYGDVDMDDDDAEMSRKDDGKEAVPVKKVKVDRGDNVRSPIQLRSRAAEKRTRGAKKQKAAAEKKAAAAAKKKAAAEKETAAENEAAAEKEAAKKKATAKKKTPAKKKQKKPKTKKVRKKTE
ncbi:uncharacterized protein At3g43530-like [Brassica napus]|uniref:uncharacterized protein At3g43530-like n=1 Tax=Brassica napus TaxID=3708 RepID=UPI0020787E72|nr:uncharacterized protein At3g43530-like [Brassica napus]